MDYKNCKARADALAEERRVELQRSVVDGPKHTGFEDTEDDEDEGGMDDLAEVVTTRGEWLDIPGFSESYHRFCAR